MGEALENPGVWADNARMVEDLGFSVLLVPDHFMPMLSPMPALMAAAAATTRLRVGDTRAQPGMAAPRGAGQGSGDG